MASVKVVRHQTVGSVVIVKIKKNLVDQAKESKLVRKGGVSCHIKV